MKTGLMKWAVATAFAALMTGFLGANACADSDSGSTASSDAGTGSSFVSEDSQNLSKLVVEIQSANGCLECDMRVLFSVTQTLSQLTQEQMAGLNAIAAKQAAVWENTILVGDYEADGKLRIDQVVGIFEGGRLTAFDITYSEGATVLESCDYADVQNGKAAQCLTGRIQESSFVSADLLAWQLDKQAVAHFIN